MLLIERDESSNSTKVKFNGVIDESVDFSKIIGLNDKALQIYAKDVSRINSVGIKLWRDSFKSFKNRGGKVQFFELAPALIAALSYLSDFIQKTDIQSICAPYHCGKCNQITLRVFDASDVQKNLPNTPSVPCSNCNSATEFDEIPEDYLSFLD